MDQLHAFAVRRLDPGHVRPGLVAAFLALLCLALILAHLWRGISERESELFNKHEWSVVQTMQLQGLAAVSQVTVMRNVLGNADYDAIALPRLDGQGAVLMLSNAQGIPRIKILSPAALRRICPADYERIKASVRLNDEISFLLQALTTPDCRK
jgi:hypothetical protein